jgi:hypothetical protein
MPAQTASAGRYGLGVMRFPLPMRLAGIRRVELPASVNVAIPVRAAARCAGVGVIGGKVL